jgi:hypothetical protein
MRKPRKRRPYHAHKRSCHRKIRHRTEYEALEAMHTMERSRHYDGHPLKVYECHVCGGWHTGHVDKKEIRDKEAKDADTIPQTEIEEFDQARGAEGAEEGGAL